MDQQTYRHLEKYVPKFLNDIDDVIILLKSKNLSSINEKLDKINEKHKKEFVPLSKLYHFKIFISIPLLIIMILFIRILIINNTR